MRGPAVLSTRPGQPSPRSRRQRFDDLTLEVVAEIDRAWHSQLGLIEYATEEAPILPADWSAGAVPLATVVPGRGSTPTRLVVFRKPIEQRVETATELRALVLTVVVEQVAELLGLPASVIDPRYEE